MSKCFSFITIESIKLRECFPVPNVTERMASL